MHPRYAPLIVFLMLLTGMLAGCGASPSPQIPHVTPVGVPVASSVSNPIQTPGSSFSSVVVTTRQIPGLQSALPKETILTTLQGMTLYIHKWQGKSSFDCSGACAKSWHLLLFKGSGTPACTMPLPGTLSLGAVAEEYPIVFYQGYPLFTYVGDQVPGQFKGKGDTNSPWQPADITVRPGL